jgi:ubiquinone/menaquinone biosynthesis C-methylase UbiE
MDLTLTPSTDPLIAYRNRDGLYAPDLLACAIIYLDFFTWLAEHPSTAEQTCEHFSITKRPTDVMLTLFAAMGLLQRENGVIQVTEVAREHLVKTSPWYLGPYYASLKDRPVCKDYLEVLKTDKPANWGSFKNEKDWTRAMEQNDFAENFTAAMDSRGVYLGQALSNKLNCDGRKKLLDIAGGSGIYSCSLVAHHPHLQAAVLEKPPVHRVAAQAIARRGFSEKISIIEGDMFALEFPFGFDLHLISNVLHDWDESRVRALLAKSYRSLEPGGMLVIHDVHINAEKTGPLPNACYSALLMHSTEGKCYSVSELFPIMRELGFKNPALTATAADRSIITATKS